MRPFLIATLLAVMICASAEQEKGGQPGPKQARSYFVGVAAENLDLMIELKLRYC